MFCSKCGHNLESTAGNFCPKCGYAIAPAQSQEDGIQSATIPLSTPPVKSKKGLIAVIIGLVVVIIIGAVYIIGNNSGSGGGFGGGSNVQCLNCSGTGYLKDAACSGFGTRAAGSNRDGTIKYAKCPTCGGSGKLKCNYCDGTGWR